MKKVLLSGSMLVFLFGLSGCGSNAESLLQQQLTAMNDKSDAMEKNAPEGKVKEVQGRMDEIKKKMDELKLSEDDKKKLGEKHKDEIMKATQRLSKAMMGNMMKGFGSQMPGMPQMPAMPKFGNPP